MGLQELIDKYRGLAMTHYKSAKSKMYFNKSASEDERIIGNEFMDIANYLTELDNIKRHGGKSCFDCKYKDKGAFQEPCEVCTRNIGFRDKWEARDDKDNQEYNDGSC